MSTEQGNPGEAPALECPQVLIDAIYEYVVPAESEDVHITFEASEVDMAFLNMMRMGEYVSFNCAKKDESKLRSYFGFSTDQLQGKDMVMGFLTVDEDEDSVTLRLRRPQIINQIL